ncbi:DNA-directed RNA polymerase sigma-70 factor [Adhaeribacter aerolatus]|uniref:DNA-directed RNA polymerase sigma-70 factor n=1 Tax=Adhaeribacter aerolatus TaxID=670289 RepID=A0A512B551_9BACT|nr:sigma-70 family RNA polymerase sigma factor [Adhaeribacter aerolatus]GEO07103.1 DNA-directed RNA polymerase sigma-70 factor [Adhaeribacter aerolatus]
MVLKSSNSSDDNYSTPDDVSQTEEQLWNDFRNGNTSSYSLIYQRYFFSLFTYGLKICPEREIVKDCIQDLFVHIWKNRDNLGPTNSIKYYLFKSLKRKLIDNFSYQSKFSPIGESKEDVFFGTVISEEQILINDQLVEEQKVRIIQALGKLTNRQKEAVILKFYENLPNEDIASKMSISVEGVYNLVSKALNKFRQNLSKAYLLLLLTLYL